MERVEPGEMAALTFWPAALMFYGMPDSVPVPVTMVIGALLMAVASRGVELWLAPVVAWMGTPRERERWRNRKR